VNPRYSSTDLLALLGMLGFSGALAALVWAERPRVSGVAEDRAALAAESAAGAHGVESPALSGARR
jgi:hypothetical protein